MTPQEIERIARELATIRYRLGCAVVMIALIAIPVSLLSLVVLVNLAYLSRALGH